LNINEYISTGILEAYVLGEVTDQERTELEANLKKYPELRAELLKVEEAQEEFLMRSAVAPPSRVKARVMDRIDKSQADATNLKSSPEANVVAMTPDHSITRWKLATAASISIAIISSYLAYNYKDQLNTTKESLDNLIAQNQQMAQDYNVVNQRLDKIENMIKIIDNPSYKRIIMKGTDAAQGSLASVYWNENTSEVYMSIQKLRDLSRDQQFQLWAIVDGKPVDAGIFNLTAGLIKMKNIPKASAFAVTIEPAGGSIAPTLSSMQVIGNI
jgi:anti-sigma-K factor RskA